MTLGQRIKVARKRLKPKMTQPMLAKAFGVTVQAISAWERDETIPEFEKLPLLRYKLRVSYAWLLSGAGNPPLPDAPEVLLDDRQSPSILTGQTAA